MDLPQPDGRVLRIPKDMYARIKALGHDPAHKEAVRDLIETISGRHRISFVAGVPNAADTMAFFEGQRSIGETFARIIERAYPETPEPEPPARTATEKVNRRMRA